MFPKNFRQDVPPATGKQTALLLAVIAVFAGLQAKGKDPTLPAVATNSGLADVPRPVDATASGAQSIQPAAKAAQIPILKETLIVAPAITMQPVSQTVPAGYPVAFTASASGSPAPSFQWQKGGVAISGVTGSSYRIASVGADDAGNYTVVVANAAGVVTSEVVELTTLVVAPSNAVVSISIQ